MKYSEFKHKEMSSGEEEPINSEILILRFIQVEPFDRILENDVNQFKDIPIKIVEPIESSALTRLGVARLAKLINDGKLSLEGLKLKVPIELIQQVDHYLNAEKFNV